ncbi:permease prefix domain 1-containing protein [Cryobacterium sp. Hh11]|uniref:permease prefix domain 1-containing protein n=1 Tax=Cryobacterium sp. Hh11 TaxID=2555868 RepID=UPI001F5454C5|nr:permease prefix domain 1-containing protein [Cryobacterium sp. Hh11]
MGRSSEIDRWRGYALRRHAIASAEVEEPEDHLRKQIEDPLANGLDHDQAFLVAIKRLGNLDAVSREFAREHSDRLGKQLVLVPDDADATRAPAWRELAVVRGIALGAGLAVKAGLTWSNGEMGLARNLGLLGFPFLAVYFGWKRRRTVPVAATLVVSFAALAVLPNVYPFAAGGSTEVLAALHAPVLLWVLVGVAYVGVLDTPLTATYSS